MLASMGLSSLEDLFAHLPQELRLNRTLDIPPGKSEYEIIDYFRELAGPECQRLRILSGRWSLSPLPPR